MKNTTIAVLVVIIVGLGAYILIKNSSDRAPVPKEQKIATTTESEGSEQSGKTPVAGQGNESESVIGKSVEGRDITAYHFGTGDTELLFVGGIHGGYEWNTALVAYQLIEYLQNASSTIPATVKVTVIPVLNPDGLNKVVGTTTGNFTKADVSSSQAVQTSGRFNANTVDLNRNFDCDWQTEGTWQNKKVSAGSAVFSEPESQAIKNYIETGKPSAVIVWYSAAGGVYASNCHNGVSTETRAMTTTYAKASGYPAHESFDSYEITGDMVNWLAKKNIPAISVLLTNHTDTEWTKNLAGIKALLQKFVRGEDAEQ